MIIFGDKKQIEYETKYQKLIDGTALAEANTIIVRNSATIAAMSAREADYVAQVDDLNDTIGGLIIKCEALQKVSDENYHQWYQQFIEGSALEEANEIIIRNSATIAATSSREADYVAQVDDLELFKLNAEYRERLWLAQAAELEAENERLINQRRELLKLYNDPDFTFAEFEAELIRFLDV